jgi:hypothetical protein
MTLLKKLWFQLAHQDRRHRVSIRTLKKHLVESKNLTHTKCPPKADGRARKTGPKARLFHSCEPPETLPTGRQAKAIIEQKKDYT